MPYVSDPDSSKSKPLANRQSRLELVVLCLCGILPLLAFTGVVWLWAVLICLGLRYAMKHWLIKRLGGFTGDCLGGVQQITELALYILVIALQHNGMTILGGVL